jgi:mannose-1-phosphate guanylyltransferase
VEKPNIFQAKQMIIHDHYVCNTGMYVWHAGELLKTVKEANYKLYEQLVKLKVDIGSRDFAKKLGDWYQTVEKTSFERAISEKVDNMSVFIANYHWKDIGNWEAVYEITPKDKDGNAQIGTYKSEITKYDSHRCLVHPYQKRILLVGVSDLIIAQSKDELLICDRKKVDLLKIALRQLKKL